MALRIKDNVDLKELEKFGYKEGKDMLCCSYSAYGKIYEQQLDDILKININNAIYVVVIEKSDKIIQLNVTTKRAFRNFSYTRDDVVEPYVKDLIQAGLVEKVEDDS